MNVKQNLHIHTTYVDGKNSPEEMILEAINRNFESIGFSEHSYVKFSTYPHQMMIDDAEKYKKEINFLKTKYKNKINVFCGLEYEFYSDVPIEGFDYIIGSVHYLDCNGKISSFDCGLEETLEFVNKNFNGDAFAFAKKYYETVSKLPQKGKFDIIGHFDLITKNNEKGSFIDVRSKEYLNLGFEAIRSLKGKIPLFEVNTGAISRGYKTNPYPQMEFLKEFFKSGFGVVITSDCHDKKFIDCFYKEAEKILEEAGFKSKWILTDKGFKEVGL